MPALVCGLDEAGRGPLAGPVPAAAVGLPDDFPVEILNDSKKLSEKNRCAAASVILCRAVAWGIGWSWQNEIDEINILRASLAAMKRAFDALRVKPHCAIADGTFCPDIGVPCTAKPKADATEHSVMAASILAKTARDRMMIRLGALYPEYGYERHKGYPTKEHRDICRRLGPSPIQRMSFRY